MSFLSELEQDPFDLDEFVERLAWRATNGLSEFSANQLWQCFNTGVIDLELIYSNHVKKCDRLDAITREEEKMNSIKITELEERAKQSKHCYSKLDSRLELVSAKVVYLGDQLEGVNTPRARAVEASQLMQVFAQFLDKSQQSMDNDVTPQSADVIHKLSLISAELPNNERFCLARERINRKYDTIEKELIEAFIRAHKEDQRNVMKDIALTLSHFKGYSQCVDAFIESAQSFSGHKSDVNYVFAEISQICIKNEKLIEEVFPSKEQVMNKFVLNVFHGRLQQLINQQLSQTTDEDQYLNLLYDLYQKTTKMSQQLEKSLGSDPNFLQKITKNIFHRFLQQYIQKEVNCLRDKCQTILSRFYESRGHHKRPLPQSSIQELKRDIQAKLIQRVLIEESLLSEEVAISILQETKLSLQRCSLLSQDLSSNALQIFDIQIQFLCLEHLDYAIEMALQSIVETKSQPELQFLDCVRQCNAICHLMEKQFQDSILPLVISTAKYGECVKRKREITDQLESKLNSGLERCLTLVVNWVRILLQSEQKKTDFKPETEDIVLATQTHASIKVCRFVNSIHNKIKDSLDGKNIKVINTELGLRLHRVITEHFQQFQFSIVGAMVAICDVNEYRKCAQLFRIPLLDQLFATLHALFNLLIVAPENLKHAMEELSLERTVVLSFVCLRADYKTALKHHFR